MDKLSVRETAEALGVSVSFDDDILSVSTDTRTIEKGSLFVCIAGENFDGHTFAQAALEKGAVAVLSERDLGLDRQIVTNGTREALLRLSGYYRNKFPITVAGVTGSVGKTTVKEMTCDVLSQKYKTLKTEGNLNNEIGLPKTLFRLDGTYEAAVIEMGMNHSGEIARLTRAASPTLSIIGNIGISHIENLGSRENILKAKLEITEGMKPDAPLILNGDDELLYNAKVTDRPVYYYGIRNKYCRFKAYDIENLGDKSAFTVDFGCGEQRVELPAPGIHNIYNALAAFTAGFLVSVDPEQAARALSRYVPSGMRQRFRTVKDICFIEDCYNASPDSVKAAINTLSGVNASRRIAVLGDMLELGEMSEEAHRKSGRIAGEAGIDILYTYGERSELTAETAIKSGVKAVRSFNSKSELADALKDILKENDAVLFKASRGMKLEEVINSIYEELEA
ncbi:MAG: UDP-N-acetylmuramoyl-tripeptide--D-alanyl-D-alanine ligase [Clostridia bacterium]|nr:UDP-N-acetylmuramoyl-tripeptide--D-alanyl-D-alanine ligase [Clostridia bacterium]